MLMLKNGGGDIMAVKDFLKVSRKTFFDPAGWLGYRELKQNTQSTWQVLRELFVAAPETTAEESITFEEAMKRHNLTPDAVNEIEKDYLFYAILFLALGVFSILFGFYLLFIQRTFIGLLLSIAVASLFGSQAFRYHFWYFQIKRRKLGATFEEWRDALLASLTKRSGP